MSNVHSVYQIKREVAMMKMRLANDPLLLEAEAMGFEITIKLPKDSLEAKEGPKDEE